MEFQVKKLKVDISTTPRQILSPISIITLKAETNYSFLPVKGKDYENLFQNILL